ncbi:MAG TPA: hypothetical protein VFH40_03565 [Gemmatimonadales bacterium]|nr:hypothetical protein [Gemmatimonadales bacterium]
MPWRCALGGMVLCSGIGFGSGTLPALRYTANQVNCAHFLETTQSSIVTVSGGRVREQSSGRTAVWQFRAEPAIEQVKIEGWLDSLVLWRKSKEGTIRPDTDGLLGGRYRGRLSSMGRYQSQVRPFIPDEVAEVADMGSALDDLFPPLPSPELRPGQAWKDSSGVTLRRLADSAMSGVPLYRFELESHRVQRSARLPGDTTRIALRQVTDEQGTFVWHPTMGLLRRERRIVVETSVPASRRTGQPVHSKIEQSIALVRDLDFPPDQNGSCPAVSS